MSRKNKPRTTQLAQSQQFGFSNKFPISDGNAYDNLNANTELYFFNHYYYMLFNYAVNMFEWINLPQEIPEKFIEYILITRGYGAFSKEMLDNPIFTMCTLIGPLDMYFEPVDITLFTINGLNKTVKNNKDAIICYNNYLRQPTAEWLTSYAARMAQAEAFIKVNLNSCKTPAILTAQNENQRLSLINAWAKFTGNEPVIVDIDAMGLADQFQAINLNCNFLVPDVNRYKKQTWDEAMLFLGIRNADTEKRERQITAEVDSNTQQIEMARLTMLNARKDCCKRINELFGWNVDVQFRLLTKYEPGVYGHVLDDLFIKNGSGMEVVDYGNNNENDGLD